MLTTNTYRIYRNQRLSSASMLLDQRRVLRLVSGWIVRSTRWYLLLFLFFR